MKRRMNNEFAALLQFQLLRPHYSARLCQKVPVHMLKHHESICSHNWGGPCGAHVFEGFFGLEDEPVKSVKMKVETGSGIL